MERESAERAAESARRTEQEAKEAAAAEATRRRNSPDLNAADLRTVCTLLADALPLLSERAADSAVRIDLLGKPGLRLVHIRGLRFRIRRGSPKVLRSSTGWIVGSGYVEGSGYTQVGGGRYYYILDVDGVIRSFGEPSGNSKAYSTRADGPSLDVTAPKRITTDSMFGSVTTDVPAIRSWLASMLG